ncbi:MAG: hypothetical protein MJ252_07025 [archaeon]|nr:hypothetical protein [archaeon]
MSLYLSSQTYSPSNVSFIPPRHYEINRYTQSSPTSPKKDLIISRQPYQNPPMENNTPIISEPKTTTDVINDNMRRLLDRENSLMDEINRKNEENNNLRLEIDRIFGECDYNQKKVSQLENENNQLKFSLSTVKLETEHSNEQMHLLTEELNNAKQKIDQLIFQLESKDNEINSLHSMMDKYSTDLRTIESKFNYATKEKESFFDLMNREKDYNEKNKTELNQIKDENYRNRAEMEKMNYGFLNLKNQYEQSEKENKTLREIKINLEEDLNKIHLENQNLKEQNRRLNDEIKSHEENKNTLQKTELGYTNEISKLKNDLASLISVSSENIKAVNYFLENYFGNVYSPNVQIPEININNSWNEKVRFDLLKKNIMNMKTKFDSDSDNYLNQIKELRNNLTKGQDDNFKFQKFIEDLNHFIINEIEDGKFFNPRSNKFNLNNNLQQNIFDLLKDFFEGAKVLKEAQDMDYLNKLIDVNNELKKDLEMNQGKNEEMEGEIFNLEKKMKYLIQEMELKDANIKSMEEMLRRKSEVEENNKKLIRDNVMLINKIKKYHKTGNIGDLYSNENMDNMGMNMGRYKSRTIDDEYGNQREDY